jgi:hypothetical protein
LSGNFTGIVFEGCSGVQLGPSMYMCGRLGQKAFAEYLCEADCFHSSDSLGGLTFELCSTFLQGTNISESMNTGDAGSLFIGLYPQQFSVQRCFFASKAPSCQAGVGLSTKSAASANSISNCFFKNFAATTYGVLRVWRANLQASFLSFSGCAGQLFSSVESASIALSDSEVGALSLASVSTGGGSVSTAEGNNFFAEPLCVFSFSSSHCSLPILRRHSPFRPFLLLAFLFQSLIQRILP